MYFHRHAVHQRLYKIGTTLELRTATSVPGSIQYIEHAEMDLRNKTTSEFRTALGSPLGVPNSQVALYIYMLAIRHLSANSAYDLQRIQQILKQILLCYLTLLPHPIQRERERERERESNDQ